MDKIRFAIAVAAVVICVPAALGQAPQASGARAIYNTGGNLGFALTRAGTADPARPLTDLGRDWVLADLAAAYQWGNLLTSCVQFDVSRFRAAATFTNTNPPAGQLWRQLDQLQRDFANAISKATCSFNLAAPSDVQAMYRLGLSAGLATGRSSHFHYDQLLAPGIASQIHADVAAIEPMLTASSGCLTSVDPIRAAISNTLRRVSSLPGKTVYQEIVNIYTMVETLTNTPACAPATPKPNAPGDVGACMRANCAGVCQGAIILLGVVSGSPACQACVARHCSVSPR